MWLHFYMQRNTRHMYVTLQCCFRRFAASWRSSTISYHIIMAVLEATSQPFLLLAGIKISMHEAQAKNERTCRPMTLAAYAWLLMSDTTTTADEQEGANNKSLVNSVAHALKYDNRITE
jgi:hypothetical protein